MRQRNKTRRVYEFKDATVIVNLPLTAILDGIVRSRFSCEVHPANGGEVKSSQDIRAFYSWQAANIALEIYRESIKK